MPKKGISKTAKALVRIMRDNEINVSEKFFMEMNSDGALSVKGIEDVSGYTQTEIFLVSAEYYISVKGKELIIRVFSGSSVEITGETEDISFIKR